MKAIIFDFNRTLFDPESDKLIDGCKDVLRALSKDRTLVLISNAADSREDLIHKLGIGDFFKKIILTKQKNKNDFISICQSLSISPSEVMVVGDRVKGEISIGNSLGMTTVQFLNGIFANELPSDEMEKPKIIITNLKELLKYG
ncbi:HAD family hydrolase [Candidatus Daviesbacteria bacterium]|nr:HAD family hydrolase [Candidatus Daviesbacteria bacterium]